MSGDSSSRLLTYLRSTTVIAGLWLLSLCHRRAFWIDEWLFPALGRVNPCKPLFVHGLPRSGTTLMHRLLATPGGNFTTPLLWEVLFAPALCEKYFFCGLFKLDHWLGGMGYRGVRWVESWGSHGGSSVHATSLQTPEEDFITLLPFGGCFLMVLAWPNSDRVWQLGYFQRLPDKQQTRLLQIYRGMVVRHLLFRGIDKHYLSKNPSFTGWVEGLQRTFSDARFVGLHRDPLTVVASQLSSVQNGLQFFGHSISPEISWRFTKMLARYWHLLVGYETNMENGRYQLVDYAQLTSTPLACVTQTLERLGYDLPPPYSTSLAEACEQATAYRSRHRYSLREYQLVDEEVLAEFNQEPTPLHTHIPDFPNPEGFPAIQVPQE